MTCGSLPAGRGAGTCATWLLVAWLVGAGPAHGACEAGAPPYEGPTTLRFTPHTTPLAATVSVDGQPEDLLLYFAGAPAGAVAAAMFVVADAATGAALWRVGTDAAPVMRAAVAAPPATMIDSRGLTYRAYAGDTDGGVWRIDLSPDALEAWRLSRLADLSDLADGPVAFPVAPDIVRGVDAAGRPFDGVVLTALADGGDDRRIDLVLLRDYGIGAEASREPLDIDDLADVDRCGEAAAACPPPTGPGWYRRGAARGDALLASPLVDGGRVLISSARQSSVDCETDTGLRFAAVVDLASGRSLLGSRSGVELGRQLLGAPTIEGGRLQIPGLASVLEELSLSPALLNARGLQPRRLYWRDLLLDRD